MAPHMAVRDLIRVNRFRFQSTSSNEEHRSTIRDSNKTQVAYIFHPRLRNESTALSSCSGMNYYRPGYYEIMDGQLQKLSLGDRPALIPMSGAWPRSQEEIPMPHTNDHTGKAKHPLRVKFKAIVKKPIFLLRRLGKRRSGELSAECLGEGCQEKESVCRYYHSQGHGHGHEPSHGREWARSLEPPLQRESSYHRVPPEPIHHQGRSHVQHPFRPGYPPRETHPRDPIRPPLVIVRRQEARSLALAKRKETCSTSSTSSASSNPGNNTNKNSITGENAGFIDIKITGNKKIPNPVSRKKEENIPIIKDFIDSTNPGKNPKPITTEPFPKYVDMLENPAYKPYFHLLPGHKMGVAGYTPEEIRAYETLKTVMEEGIDGGRYNEEEITIWTKLKGIMERPRARRNSEQLHPPPMRFCPRDPPPPSHILARNGCHNHAADEEDGKALTDASPSLQNRLVRNRNASLVTLRSLSIDTPTTPTTPTTSITSTTTPTTPPTSATRSSTAATSPSEETETNPARLRSSNLGEVVRELCKSQDLAKSRSKSAPSRLGGGGSGSGGDDDNDDIIGDIPRSRGKCVDEGEDKDRADGEEWCDQDWSKIKINLEGIKEGGVIRGSFCSSYYSEYGPRVPPNSPIVAPTSLAAMVLEMRTAMAMEDLVV